MVLSYHLSKYPYRLLWHLLHMLGRTRDVAVYVSDPLDYVVLQPVLRHLPAVPFVVRNRRTARFLKQSGVTSQRMPAFPRAVIMCRHATHRFPERRILKIGFRHGAYHFKTFAKAQYYNAFDVYFMTSAREVEEARARGITTARAVGFPKLDPAFDATYDEEALEGIRSVACIDPSKKTVIFTATWDKSNMSAIGKWIDMVDALTHRYNVLVTVHPWMSSKYVNRLRKLKVARYLEHPDVLPYLLLSDVLVGDTSSVIAEFCALDKPIITFRVPTSTRTVPEISRLLADISIQINHTDELEEAIEESLTHPRAKSAERQQAIVDIFGVLDGHAGERAASVIRELLPSLRRDPAEPPAPA